MTFAMWWAEQYGKTGEVPEQFFNMMRDAYERGKSDEREACAELCESLDVGKHEDIDDLAEELIHIDCATAIRGRK